MDRPEIKTVRSCRHFRRVSRQRDGKPTEFSSEVLAARTIAACLWWNSAASLAWTRSGSLIGLVHQFPLVIEIETVTGRQCLGGHNPQRVKNLVRLRFFKPIPCHDGRSFGVDDDLL